MAVYDATEDERRPFYLLIFFLPSFIQSVTSYPFGVDFDNVVLPLRVV